MDAAAIHDTAPAREVLRDCGGTIVGTIEHQRLTGPSVARNASGVLVGTFDHRAGLTRDASGKIIARSDVLPALLFRP